jgi:hypothetical protein
MKSVSCLALLLTMAGSAFAQTAVEAPAVRSGSTTSTSTGTTSAPRAGTSTGSGSSVAPGLPGTATGSDTRVGAEGAGARATALGTSSRSSAPSAAASVGPAAPAAGTLNGARRAEAPAAAPAVAARPSASSVSVNPAFVRAFERRFLNLVPGGQEAIDAVAAMGGNPSRVDTAEEMKVMEKGLTMAAADASIARERIVASLKASVSLNDEVYSDDIAGARNCFGTQGQPGYGAAAQSTFVELAPTILEMLGGADVVNAMSREELRTAVRAARPAALGRLTSVTDSATLASRVDHLTTSCKVFKQ